MYLMLFATSQALNRHYWACPLLQYFITGFANISHVKIGHSSLGQGWSGPLDPPIMALPFTCFVHLSPTVQTAIGFPTWFHSVSYWDYYHGTITSPVGFVSDAHQWYSSCIRRLGTRPRRQQRMFDPMTPAACQTDHSTQPEQRFLVQQPHTHPDTPYIIDSSSLGICYHLWWDVGNTMQQGVLSCK